MNIPKLINSDLLFADAYKEMAMNPRFLGMRLPSYGSEMFLRLHKEKLFWQKNGELLEESVDLYGIEIVSKQWQVWAINGLPK